ncbi:MAG: hypothetical protein QXW09_01925 [Thermoproteota archaeon]
MFILLLSSISCRADSFTLTKSYPSAGFKVSIELPEHVSPGDTMQFNVSITSNRTLRFILQTCLIYGAGYFTEWQKLVETEIQAGKTATGSGNFTIPSDINSGPIMVWIFIEFTGEDDYQLVEGEKFYSRWSAVFQGPYVESPQVAKMRNDLETLTEKYENQTAEYLSLLLNFRELQGAFDNVSIRFMELSTNYQALNYSYSNLWQDYMELNATYTEMLGNYTELSEKYESTATTLEATKMQLYAATGVALVLLVVLILRLIKGRPKPPPPSPEKSPEATIRHE